MVLICVNSAVNGFQRGDEYRRPQREQFGTVLFTSQIHSKLPWLHWNTQSQWEQACNSISTNLALVYHMWFFFPFLFNYFIILQYYVESRVPTSQSWSSQNDDIRKGYRSNIRSVKLLLLYHMDSLYIRAWKIKNIYLWFPKYIRSCNFNYLILYC